MRWIRSDSGNLPDFGKEVLCYADGFYICYLVRNPRCIKEFVWKLSEQEDEIFIENVSHWMNLPGPPKDKMISKISSACQYRGCKRPTKHEHIWKDKRGNIRSKFVCDKHNQKEIDKGLIVNI